MRSACVLLLVSVLASGMFLIEPSAADECLSYEDFFHLLSTTPVPGYPIDMVYHDSYVYLLGGEPELVVYDVNDLYNLQAISRISLPDDSYAMAIDDGVAYLTQRSSILLIDLTDPYSPSIIGSCPIDSRPLSVAVQGDYLYVAAYEYGEDNHGVYICDVSDPYQPSMVNRVEVGSYPSEIIIDDGCAYLLINSGLVVLDLTNPIDPAVSPALHIPGDAKGLAHRGDYAYVTCWADEYPPDGDGLYVIDTSTAMNPELVGEYTEEDAPRIGVTLWDQYAIIGNGAGVTFVDLTDPTDPQPVADVGGFYYISDVIAVDATLFVGQSGSLSSCHLKEEFVPPPIATAPEADDVHYIAKHGDFCYLTSPLGNELNILEMTDPLNPEVVATLVLPFDWCHCIKFTESEDGVAYAYVGGAGDTDGFTIVNIDDPMNPVIVDQFFTVSSPRIFDIDGGFLYAPSGIGEIQIFDISNPESPEHVNSLDLRYTISLVEVDGSILYAGRRSTISANLYAIDISVPMNPVVIGTSFIPKQPYALIMRDELLYIPDGQHGLLIMDVSDPEAMKFVSRTEIGVHAEGLVLDDDNAYIADWWIGAGVHLIDISSPDTPEVTGYFQLDKPLAIELVNGYLAVGCQDAPLAVVPLQCGASAVPEIDESRSSAITIFSGANPSLNSVTLRLALPEPGEVDFALFDLSGRRIRELHCGSLPAGESTYSWDGEDGGGQPMPAGVYFARAIYERSRITKRIVLIRQ